jgi:MFS family permease
MNSDFHQRARILIDQAHVAGISQQEESWLKNHTIGCTECRAYAEISARVIQGLGSFSFDIDPGLTAHVQKTITLAAETAAVRRFVRRRFLAGGMIGLLLTSIGSLASWEAGGLVAAHIQIVPWLWRTGVVLWSLPSLCIAFVLIFAWHYLAGNFNEERIA